MTAISLPEPFPRWSFVVVTVALVMFALESVFPAVNIAAAVYYGSAMGYLVFTKRYTISGEYGLLNMGMSIFVFMACWWFFWVAAQLNRPLHS